MIRKYKESDLPTVIEIWYEASTIAHPFLKREFVARVKKDMEEIYIPKGETWVFEDDERIIGFIGMIGNEIGGLFVKPDQQSKGIGTKLVDFIKQFHSELEVEVFKENPIGRAFYDKYGFKHIKEFFHEDSGNQVLRLKLS